MFSIEYVITHIEVKSSQILYKLPLHLLTGIQQLYNECFINQATGKGPVI